MSSIAPLASWEIEKAYATRGIKILDTPISGGEPNAIEAFTLVKNMAGIRLSFLR
jgi:3-hydroxyisobutyrate dehydrogenase-like beta-hydroxyacid dehydrogenase